MSSYCYLSKNRKIWLFDCLSFRKHFSVRIC